MPDAAEPNIKDYREKELKAFVFGNILLILLGCGVLPIAGNSIQDIVQDFVNSAVISVTFFNSGQKKKKRNKFVSA